VLGLIKRHEVQVLRRAGHSQTEVSRLTGISLSEIRRIEAEEPVENYDDAAERRRRGIGRPSKAEPLRAFVVDRLARDPRQTSLDLLRGAKLAGYQGSKSAFYALVAKLRPEVTRAVAPVGDLPGDLSQHGFGDVEVHFGSAGSQRVHFFVSQLAYSRWCAVTLTPDRQVESLLRALVEHFARIGGVPLVAVFDRHNAGAIVTNVEGVGRSWHPSFAQAILDLGIGLDVRGRGRHERSGGSVEKLVRWVKTSFFATREFADARDLEARLRDWNDEANTRAASRETGVIPETRMAEDRVRLRPLLVRSEDFALRLPVTVGPTPEVVHEGISYPMPAEAVGKPAMLYLHSGRVRIVGDGFDIQHPRRWSPRAPEFSE
jgi:transposase